MGADFSGMSNDPDGLVLNEIQQTAIVEVDELGTTAAAATRIGEFPFTPASSQFRHASLLQFECFSYYACIFLDLCGGGCLEILEVVADRSFYFQIVDEEMKSDFHGICG